MKKIEAKTLEEAYEKAAKEFECSITDLKYEIVQHPSSGFLGIGAKKAIIVASRTEQPRNDQQRTSKVGTDVTTAIETSERSNPVNRGRKPETNKPKDTNDTSYSVEDEILNGFFDSPDNVNEEKSQSIQQNSPPAHSLDDKKLSGRIEEELKVLMSSICFEIDVVEVDVVDGAAYIFIDGKDAALLIGKEGYRYNALSYLFYNWIRNRYGLFIKLEIAQFFASQQEMIRNYIQPVIEHVRREGWGKTRPLDGILVQIALEQLREEFPNKYVAVKHTRRGERYILINEFNKRS